MPAEEARKTWNGVNGKRDATEWSDWEGLDI